MICNDLSTKILRTYNNIVVNFFKSKMLRIAGDGEEGRSSGGEGGRAYH